MVKGFVRKSENGLFVLVDNPDVKSCCVGKKEGHLVLEGDFAHLSGKRAYRFEGVVEKDVLKGAHVVQEGSFFVWGGVALLVFLVGYTLIAASSSLKR